MPYLDDDGLIRWILGDHIPMERGTLELNPKEKDEYDEDKRHRIVGYRAALKAATGRLPLGFKPPKGDK